MATATQFIVPPLNERKRIPARTIRALATLIAKKFQPKKLYFSDRTLMGNQLPGRMWICWW